ncbi:type IV toxin-antitoxin system AbiEi family antitoxin domain-containing protein [Nocardioides lijunqiniae]|uniref:type IV toxin-antitoxin system AbiEi family antitoxin domain-containing protein n=1 Tax=Nocardioides lijunqiniae TaxID=2760832 RepID=UPI001877F39E|nr:type IV toxin-antitoxin system AbiEi family antitoxin domain-containing protein [Nocardioides lijunqiniae]
MRPEVIALMGAQHGLITRRQAIDVGISADRVDRIVRSGGWVALRRGVYADAELVAAAATMRARRLWVDRAVSLSLVRPHVMSHDSSALELGLAILHPPQPRTHVTRPGLVGSHRRREVTEHLAPYRDDQVVTVAGRRVLDLARTAVDIAREHPLEYGVAACDSARRMGCELDALSAAVLPMRNWPHVTRAREAVELSDAGADNVAETLARLLVSELGLGRPQTQFGLTDGRRTAWCDLRLGRHLIEFDGRIKYQRLDEGGVAQVAADEVVWREKRRQDWLCGFKLGMSRLVWSDLWGRERRETLERLRREYGETTRLFGTSIEDLTPFLARGPRTRPPT